MKYFSKAHYDRVHRLKGKIDQEKFPNWLYVAFLVLVVATVYTLNKLPACEDRVTGVVERFENCTPTDGLIHDEYPGTSVRFFGEQEEDIQPAEYTGSYQRTHNPQRYFLTEEIK